MADKEVDPIEIVLPSTMPSVLGVGAFLKNRVCLINGTRAVLSRDNGTLDNVEAIRAYERVARDFLTSAHPRPVGIAHDLHPDFPSTRFALASGLPAFGVQHHHAHIAAVMAEHGVMDPVLGLALDGFGLGTDKKAWGGELLCVHAGGFRRLGYLRPLPQPGGDIAARQPWRMGAAALWALGRGDSIATRYAMFPAAATLGRMMERGVHAPRTSSAGRLFDAACGILGVKPVAAFEGEAPMALESLVRETVASQAWTMTTDENGCLILDMLPLLEKLIDMDAEEGAALFHGTLIEGLAAWVCEASARTGIRRVAFGGGCFLNKVLCEGLSRKSAASGFELFWPSLVPAGDAAIGLGQAWAAAWAIKTGSA